MIGRKCGRLTVVCVAPSSAKGMYWHCMCECGQSITARGSHLRSGNIQSCGCLARENCRRISHLGNAATRTHGMGNTPEYRSWREMLRRCYDKRSAYFHRYGLRNITICAAWKNSFVEFFSDMGKRPSDIHSLDRRDNDGNYERDNCHWATPREQANNMIRNRIVFFRGKEMTAANAIRLSMTDRPKPTIYWRLRHGVPFEEAIL